MDMGVVSPDWLALSRGTPVFNGQVNEDRPAGENGSGPRSRGELGVAREVGDTEARVGCFRRSA